MSTEPDPWREQQIARLVEQDGQVSQLSRRRRLSLFLASLAASLILCLGLAALSGHWAMWPWAILLAVGFTVLTTWWVFIPEGRRRALAERRARRAVPTWNDANDPRRSGSGG